MCMQTFSSGGVPIRIMGESHSGAKRPALIILHGAGGNLSYWWNAIASKLALFGVACFAPQYFERTGTERATGALIRDGKHFPLWLETVRDAVGFVAAQPGVDASRIAVLGVSLGAYLAMALAVDDRQLAAVIEISGGVPEEWATRMHSGMPPILIVHGADDTVVPVSEARKLEGALQRAGVTYESRIFEGQGHWLSREAQVEALATAGQFLFRHLQPRP